MVHHGQRLPLGLEAGDDLAAVHAGLDDLEGDLALHRLGLLGHEDGAHAAFANLLKQLVRADDRARAFQQGLVDGRTAGNRRLFQKTPRPEMIHDQFFDVAPEFRIVAASLIQKGGALCGGKVQRLVKKLTNVLIAFGGHAAPLNC